MKNKHFDMIAAGICAVLVIAGTALAIESFEEEPYPTAPEVIMREPIVFEAEQDVLPAYDTNTEQPAEVSVYLGNFKVTGYVPNCEHCCGKADGIMASGIPCITGFHCATNKDFSFGSELHIDGLGTFIVGDRGVGDGVIDIACASHEDCYDITGNYDVYARMEV